MLSWLKAGEVAAAVAEAVVLAVAVVEAVVSVAAWEAAVADRWVAWEAGASEVVQSEAVGFEVAARWVAECAVVPSVAADFVGEDHSAVDPWEAWQGECQAGGLVRVPVDSAAACRLDEALVPSPMLAFEPLLHHVVACQVA